MYGAQTTPEMTDSYFFEQAEELAHTAGLTPSETNALIGLCLEQTEYPTYGSQRAEVEGLADGNGLRVERVGYSNDYPEDSDTPHPIDVVILGGGEGPTAYIEGVQHASERIGAATARVLRLLGIEHRFYRRMGYDRMIISDHNEPDGMHLQGDHNGPITLADYPNLYRGSGSDQHAWGFPIPGTEQPLRGDVAATLHVLNHYDPVFFGSLHGMFAHSEIITSRISPDEAGFYGDLYSSLGMSTSHLPEPHTACHTSGISTVPLGRDYQPSRLPNNAPITNVCSHLKANRTKLFTPDFETFRAVPNNSQANSSSSLLEIARAHIIPGLQLVDKMREYLNDPIFSGYITAGDSPEVGRLHRAAAWWVGSSGTFNNVLQKIENAEPAYRDRQISEVNRATIYPYALSNGAVYAGNIARLARLAGLNDVHDAASRDTLGALNNLPSLQPTPIPHQVAAQSIAVIAAMKFARQ